MNPTAAVTSLARNAASARMSSISVPLANGTGSPMVRYFAWRKKRVRPSCPVWKPPVLVRTVS